MQRIIGNPFSFARTRPVEAASLAPPLPTGFASAGSAGFSLLFSELVRGLSIAGLAASTRWNVLARPMSQPGESR
jgi:hypothetical protein